MHTAVPLIEVYNQGTCWSLVPGGTDALSWYGGPPRDFVGSEVAADQAILHHIATLNLPVFGVGLPRFGFSIPLIYSPCHDGCVIEYKKTAPGAVAITMLDPIEATEGIPYPGYPPLLPFYRLGIGGTKSVALSDLRQRIANTAWEVQDDRLYAIVMEHPAIGHSLFSPDTDVEIVFEYAPAEGTFRATNQCL